MRESRAEFDGLLPKQSRCSICIWAAFELHGSARLVEEGVRAGRGGASCRSSIRSRSAQLQPLARLSPCHPRGSTSSEHCERAREQ